MLSTEIIPKSIGHYIPYDEGMKKSDLYERFFIMSVAERVEKSAMSHSEFGRKVFGNDSGSRLWRATREEARKRSVSIGEALMMAEALGTDLPALFWEITQEAKIKGILS